jgi:hypothetical protein
MSLAFLVHTNGCGSSFQVDAHSSIASSSAFTELKLVFVSALRVSIENHVSIRSSHDDDVGVECRCHRFRFGCANHFWIDSLLRAERLSSTTCTSRPRSTCASIHLKNGNTSAPVCVQRVRCNTSPVDRFIAANRSIVPLRL